MQAKEAAPDSIRKVKNKNLPTSIQTFGIYFILRI